MRGGAPWRMGHWWRNLKAPFFDKIEGVLYFLYTMEEAGNVDETPTDP